MLRLILLWAGLIGAAPALALESLPVESPRARVTLVSEAAAVAPGQPVRLLLRQVLAPGWHTYWSNPGDAGAPPELALTLPPGASVTPLAFPAPQRIPFGPLVNFGYEGEVAFPLTLTPPADLPAGGVLTVEASGTWLTCADVCIPEEGSFRLDLPVEAAPRPDPAEAAAFAAAEASLPRPSPWAARAGFDGAAGALELTGPELSAGQVRNAFFFPAAPGLLDHAAPQPLSVRDGALTLGLTRPAGAAAADGPLAGVVAITDAAGLRAAYAVAAPLGAVPARPAGAPPPGRAAPWQDTPWQATLGQATLWAALGGLLLNLMPCVFPILAMKAMALAKLSGAARGTIRAQAAGTTAGVVLSFLALGAALAGLRAAGVAAGWGFQFTQPAFVAAMAWLMLAVGLNLSGAFTLRGPVLAGGAPRGGVAGSVLTGVLAVLVATPCTAPFMAAALGATLVLPPVGALAVFAALGLGMAAPYALLALFPGLAAFLPRPGAWMERLRQALAFPMYGAAAWLAWVLAQQAGPDGVLLVLAGGLLVGFAAWAWGQAQPAGPRGRRVGGALAGAALLAALALLPRLGAAPEAPSALAGEEGETWSAARLAGLRAEGRPVFVNLTAAWCITCKVNERVALDRPAVREAFARRGVAMLTGDWTRGDPAITALLRAQGRDGVPLYLLYPPGGGEPAQLPQILTEGIVLRALEAAWAGGRVATGS
ncbi:thioredoxin family protein [Roseomonas sp. OT10]|uniref:protein-disulfide reductase DsbD family protein n=1 Tax=Roseomonas cutis TaxID=2897332 RepID=UPI001E379AAD|nr:thioredoxin family protein [Roseomonas sp. OT10]UFN47544.1 thioredoxin family protein [Roseomonas sp. OT10]